MTLSTDRGALHTPPNVAVCTRNSVTMTFRATDPWGFKLGETALLAWVLGEVYEKIDTQRMAKQTIERQQRIF